MKRFTILNREQVLARAYGDTGLADGSKPGAQTVAQAREELRERLDYVAKTVTAD